AGATGAPPAERNLPVSLAPRELDVLTCIASGATNAAAAELLGLRPETVKGYLRSSMRKLGAHTRLEAVVAARREGLLP
ncbi:LuxR C-terminal-related transcriptional regulator, partial [Streptomyces sp. SID3212]|uniref:response regulator transcription factor n=2 Tax=unclassified Streptomyces TaxID=2593676 RepID=UPI00136C592A